MMPTPDRSPLLLDPAAMHDVLRAAIPGLRETRTCSIRQTRRRISRKTEEAGAPYLGVLYELAARSGQATQWCYVKAFSHGVSRTAPDAHAALRLDDLDALAWLLPHDPALPHLAAFLDPRRVRAELRQLLADDDTRDTAVHTTVVRHEPESHCTARFTLTLHGAERAVYGKCYAGDEWQAAAAAMRRLHAASAAATAFAIALPLGASPALHATWQAEAAGQPLRDQLAGACAGVWLGRVAGGIERLQRLSPGRAPVLGPREILARTVKQCGKLQRADASLADVLRPALARLAGASPEPAPAVLVHGDLHADQLLCDGNRLVLFDFDNLCAASPAFDAADFASQLLTDDGFAPRRRRELAHTLVQAFHARFGAAAQAEAFDWHLRALLLRKAYSFFVRHRAGWQQRVREAAELAVQGAAAVGALETA